MGQPAQQRSTPGKKSPAPAEDGKKTQPQMAKNLLQRQRRSVPEGEAGAAPCGDVTAPRRRGRAKRDRAGSGEGKTHPSVEWRRVGTIVGTRGNALSPARPRLSRVHNQPCRVRWHQRQLRGNRGRRLGTEKERGTKPKWM